MRVGLLTAVATAIAIGAIAITGGGGGGSSSSYGPGTGSGITTANLWIDQNGGTCSRSVSAIAYSGAGDAASCSGLQSAYTACRNGDVVGIQAGTYTASSQQNVITNNTNLSSQCDIRGVGVVTFSGSNGDSDADAIQFYQISHLKLSYVAVTGGEIKIISNTATATNDVTLDHTSVASSVRWLGTVTNITVTHSEIFGANADASHPTVSNYSGTGGTDPANITITDNYFHDFLFGSHDECLQIDGGTNLSIKRNRFNHCGSTACLSAGDNGGHVDGLVIEGNVTTDCDPSAYSGNLLMANVTIAYNTFNSGSLAINNGTLLGPITLRGNYVHGGIGGGSGSCPAGITYSHNVVTSTACGSDTLVGSFDVGADGYHLTNTANARAAGDPANCGDALDVDGESRPQPAATTCDAGADEVP